MMGRRKESKIWGRCVGRAAPERASGEFPALPNVVIWKRLGSFLGAAAPRARAGEDGNGV